ncbi:MAG TPA: AAA family ATPase [Mycobacteriales bacterium]|nr:AAA family ATPase [Mycobacteriales bacterium]
MADAHDVPMPIEAALGGGTSVALAEQVDVGRIREERRRRRLWRIAAYAALPTTFLWYRVLSNRPFDVFALPHIDWLLVAPLLFFAALILLLGGQFFVTGRSPHSVYRPEQLDVRLSDVVGIDPVKEEVVRSLNLFLAHETYARTMGGRPRRALLFEGGPGTGKTHTAKAMAREAGVPFLFATATSFQSSFQGATARKVRSYFRTLRKVARREGGAIGFIDEVDAIGFARSGMSSAAVQPAVAGGFGAPGATGASGAAASGLVCCGGLAGLPGAEPAHASLVTQPFVGGGDLGSGVHELLVQLQSFEEPLGMERLVGRLASWVNLLLPSSRQLPVRPVRPSNIMLIAATNRADKLDPALLRPGRFDRQLHFDLPDRAGRLALIGHFVGRRAHHEALDAAEQRASIASVTQGYSPAMLEGLFDEALVNAVRRGAPTMNREDVERARLTMEVGMGQPKAYTEHERRLVATHEAGHTVAAHLVAPHRRLEVLSIIKRRDALGLLAHGDPEDVYTRSRGELSALIQIAMGGQCAEEIWFGDVSTGPGGDLLYATNVAAQMVGAAGMEGTLISFAAVRNGALNDTNIVGRVLADSVGRAMVEEVLTTQKVLTRQLLTDHRHLVEALRDALVERDELIGPQITEVLDAAAAEHERQRAQQVIDLRDTPGAPSVGRAGRPRPASRSRS